MVFLNLTPNRDTVYTLFKGFNFIASERRKMGAIIPKNDLGEKIRSRLVCPMIALDILQQSYPDKKISDEMKRLLESAKEEIVFIADLSWKFSRGTRWNQGREKSERSGNKLKRRFRVC